MTSPTSTQSITPLHPEIKTKWLEALRSGEYKQGRSLLHYKTDEGEDCFCCLGVLCDIAAKEGVIDTPTERQADPEIDVDVGADQVFGYAGTTTMPPPRVENWALRKNDYRSQAWYVPTPDFEDEDHPLRGGDTVSLAELNDEANFTFAQIADVIEAFL